ATGMCEEVVYGRPRKAVRTVTVQTCGGGQPFTTKFRACGDDPEMVEVMNEYGALEGYKFTLQTTRHPTNDQAILSRYRNRFSQNLDFEWTSRRQQKSVTNAATGQKIRTEFTPDNDWSGDGNLAIQSIPKEQYLESPQLSDPRLLWKIEAT